MSKEKDFKYVDLAFLGKRAKPEVQLSSSKLCAKVEDTLIDLLAEKAPPVKRKSMEVLRCPHKNQKHYAKGMCNHCYHKYGRNLQVQSCPHTDRPAYAKGKCQNCYLNEYNKQKRRSKKEQQLAAVKGGPAEPFESLSTKRFKA